MPGACWPLVPWVPSLTNLNDRAAPCVHAGCISLNSTMVTINTPKHTDPVTKNKEKVNEAEAKDKPSGKTKKTRKK